MSTSSTMRALVLETANGPFVSRQLPRPVAGPGQVLVEIAASGVNPLDTKIRAAAAGHAKHPLPAILGMDLAGVVRAVGAGVERFRVGDDVYGLTGGVAGLQGSLAEYAAVDADLLGHKPANLSMREAAALPLVAITICDRHNFDSDIARRCEKVVHTWARGSPVHESCSEMAIRQLREREGVVS